MSQIEKVIYTAKTHTTGGRDGASRTSDGRLDVKLSSPGAPGGGTNPEQLFAAGWSACFLGAMGVAAGKMKVALPADPRGPQPDRSADTQAKVEEEFGDLLFVMANVARHLKLDPEAALWGANGKFERRFAHIEQRLAEGGRTPEGSTLAEMDALWDEAKAHERS